MSIEFKKKVITQKNNAMILEGISIILEGAGFLKTIKKLLFGSQYEFNS